MSRIVVVGGANWDRTWRLPSLPSPGETVVGELVSEGAGGKGLNVAVALGRLQADVALIARVGADAAGDALRTALVDAGVVLDGVGSLPGPSGQAAVWLSDGQTVIAVARGANAALDADGVRSSLAVCADGCELIVVQAEVGDAALEAAARWATERRAGSSAASRRPGPLLLLSPAPVRALPDELWQATGMVVCNAVEAADLTGAAVADPLDAEVAAMSLVERGPTTVVITLGAEGAVVARSGRATYLPPFTVEVVDPTGAGDCFCAAFGFAVVEGMDIFASAGYAMAAAAVCVGRTGAAAAMPTRDEVERMAHSVDLRRDPGTSPVLFPR